MRRSESITAAARSLRVTPSQVSKAISRLESQIGASLFKRTTRGVLLSDAGKRALPHLEEIAARLRAIQSEEGAQQLEITAVAPSYLASPLLSAIVESATERRVRGLMMAPSLIRAFSSENLFDVALTIGAMEFPRTWVSTKIGELHEGVFGSAKAVKAIGKQPVDPSRLSDMTFVAAIDGVNGHLVPVNDGCPLGVERRFGHHAVQLSLALDFAARTDQLVYGVAIAARDHLDRGAVSEIRVRGWSRSSPLYLTVNADRVLSRVQQSIVKSLRAELHKLGEKTV